MAKLVEAVIADEGSKQDRQGRRILDSARWEQLIGEYLPSGMTQAQFARREGIKFHSLVGRLGRHRRKSSRAALKQKFLEARLPAAPEVRLEATFANDLVVRGDNPEALARLIRALEA